MTKVPAIQRLVDLLSEEAMSQLADELEAACKQQGESWVSARYRIKGGLVRDSEVHPPVRRVAATPLTRRQA